jgi:hypothetical protein
MTRTIAPLLLLLLAASTAAAELPPLGVRGGITDWDGLNQFHFGLDARLGEILPNVELTPNLEIGLGDDATIISVNGDVTYQFTELVSSPWGLYGGGALALHILDFDNVPGSGSDTDLGLNLVAGGTKVFANGHLGFAEIRIGVLDSPDLKLTVGYSLF